MTRKHKWEGYDVNHPLLAMCREDVCQVCGLIRVIWKENGEYAYFSPRRPLPARAAASSEIPCIAAPAERSRAPAPIPSPCPSWR
jgi:hypothetical protein